MRGPVLLVAALGLWAVLDAVNKLLADAYPVEQAVGVRFAALLALVLLARLVRPGLGGPLATRRPLAQVARGAAMLGSAGGFFLALRDIPLAEGYLVYFTAPFLVLGLFALFLGERAPPRAWAWCGVGFVGVLLALWPGLSAGLAGGGGDGGGGPGPLAAYAWALFGTLSYAAVMTLNRSLRHEHGPARLLVWSSVPPLLLLAPFALASWVPPAPGDLALMLLNGVLAGAATLCLAAAFRHASAARLAPLEFSALAWAVLLDAALWSVLPGPWTLAGAAVVVLAGLMAQRGASSSGVAPVASGRAPPSRTHPPGDARPLDPIS